MVDIVQLVNNDPLTELLESMPFNIAITKTCMAFL
jgi:hypothetical protein